MQKHDQVNGRGAPVPNGAHRMPPLDRFLAQVGRLKDLPRAGWVRRGLPDPESVADHSFRAAVLALVLASELKVDPARLLAMLVVHDLAESDPTVGDITPYCGISKEEKRARERAAMERLCAGVPGGEALRNLWHEYDENVTPEAQAAHQLDALEMALQAREYQARAGGEIDLDEFRESALKKIRHPALLRLLDPPNGSAHHDPG